MGMEMGCSMFLWVLTCLFAYDAAASAASIPAIYYLNSSLPSTWQNINSVAINRSRVTKLLSRDKAPGLGFVAGFYCSQSPGTDDCTSYFFSVMVVGGDGDPAVVWSANRDQPVKENATLQLTQDGDLILGDSGRPFVWSSNTSGKSVVGMNLTELGNLVLFNDSGNPVWQSFDHPTDTLLAGQWLYQGTKLVSSSSTTNMSGGLYYATLNMSSGLAAFTQVANGGPQMYYQLAPTEGSSNQSSGVGRCRLRMKNGFNSSAMGLRSGGFLMNLGTSQDAFVSNSFQPSTDSAIEYVKLGSDGHLKLYRRNNGSASANVAADMVTADLGVCQLPRSCGDYGVCKDGQCSCPSVVDGKSYFKQLSLRDNAAGCSRIKSLSCQSNNTQSLVEMKDVNYFNFIDSSAAVSGIKDIEACKQACLGNCLCGAAFFKYNNTLSEGNCYLPSEVLSIREGRFPNSGFSSAAYIKVENGSGGKNLTKLIAIIAGSASLVIFFILIVLSLAKKFRTREEEDDGKDYVSHVPGMPVRFSYDELRVATRDFKERLGGGGFGSVFKGVLQDGTVIAVKRLHKMGNALREFLAEVETIGSIHHYNLVRLVGFCAEKSNSLLVYEYMSNGSLDNWIFCRGGKPCLDWEARKKVILDIAKGLAYLHEECRQRIIHLDIKPQNVLLDENFNAKISDFGLSTLIDRDETSVLTTLTLRGTPGYIAPECGHTNITVKADIYSFGIVLLEIVSGRKNLDGSRAESSKHLLGLFQRKAGENRLLDIVENLDDVMHEPQREETERLIRIAAWCLQDDPTRRPLMSTVVKVLEGVMDVDPNIEFNFAHATGKTSSVVNDAIVSMPPQASVLSNPR